MSKLFLFQNPDEKNINIIKTLLENESYSKYQIEAKVNGEMICSKIENDESLKPSVPDITIKETYQDYLKLIARIPRKNYKWVCDIIDGKAEQEHIIYSNDSFILIPTYTWDQINMDNLHILAIFKDMNLKSIRSLNGTHVNLLENVLKLSFENIEKKYKIKSNKLRSYFHYHPSTWQLHIHFNLIENRKADCLIDGSHNAKQVIFNLKMNSDYYKIIDLYVPKNSSR
jgi:m7GpppX diphosphatase